MIVDCAAYIDGHRVEVDLARGGLERFAGNGVADHGADDTPISEYCDGFVWLGLRMPNEAELADVCSSLDLDEVVPAEVLAPHARPVLALDGPTLQLVVRTARYDDVAESISLGEITLLVGPRSIVSVRHGHASPLSKLRASLERDPDRMRLGPLAVLTAVIARVIDDYQPALDGFENDVLEVERDVFSDTRRQPVQRLYELKREVRKLLVAIDSLQDPLARLHRELLGTAPPEVLADLAEAADQLDRTVARAQSLSGLLDSALTASLTQVTVQQNADMRKISAWVAMAAVPTMIAGIYGMNFDSMPELRWDLGYPLILGVMGGVVALLYRSFKRSGWL